MNRLQKRLQDPTINFKTAADDLNGLRSIFESKSEELRSTALAKGIKKCKEWDIEMVCRIRRKKKMPGENAADAGLTSSQEINRVMMETVNRIIVEMDDRFKQLNYLDGTFGFLLDMKNSTDNL